MSGVGSRKALPLVKVLATGGTIANTPSGRLHAGEVADAIPALRKVARLEVEELFRVASSAITVEGWLTLSRRINEILSREPAVKGVVVTHGSNTLEETGYFLSLTVKSDNPVVLTAAQRQFTTLSSDSPKNFLQAVRVAASDDAKGMGALIVTNDVINAARDVSKDISTRVETYSSRDLGALGFVDDDRITFYRLPVKQHTRATPFDVRRLRKLPRVDIVYTYAGADGALIEAATARGAEGLVIAGFPTGSATPAMDESIREMAAKGIPVVMTNRGGMGRVMDKRAREARPLLWGDNLTPVKARILLMLALTRTRDPAELQRIFEKF
ncbi:MAG: asparaginase [Candidatus Rokuibacteriota bacterium]